MRVNMAITSVAVWRSMHPRQVQSFGTLSVSTRTIAASTDEFAGEVGWDCDDSSFDEGRN